MTMTLLQQIQEKIAQIGIDKVVKELGCKSSKSEKIRDILQALMDATEIDTILDKGYFDFKYDSQGLLKALCEVLKISKINYDMTIEAYNDKHDRLLAMKSPYIFIYTGFKRMNEPIFALAAMEHSRNIFLDKRMYLSQTQKEIDTFISHSVKLHYKCQKGVLPLWGKIKVYVYHDVEGNKTVYSPLGEVIVEDDIIETRATVNI